MVVLSYVWLAGPIVAVVVMWIIVMRWLKK